MSLQAPNLKALSQQYAYSSLQMHENIARKAGFSGTDHKYLGFFLTQGRLTAGELAGLTGLTTGAVTGLIDRFEKKGLIQRQLDPHDRRKVWLQPDVDKIRGLLAPFYHEYQVELERLIARHSPGEQAVIAAFFEASIALIQHTTAQFK